MSIKSKAAVFFLIILSITSLPFLITYRSLSDTANFVGQKSVTSAQNNKNEKLDNQLFPGVNNDDARSLVNLKSKIENSKNILVLSYLISFVSSVILLFICSACTLGRLKALSERVVTVSKGDLRPYPAKIVAKDDLALMHRTFDLLTSNLGDLMMSAKFAIMNQMNSVKKISNDISNVHQSATNQATATEETSSTVVEMAAQIEQNVNSVFEVSKSIEKTASAAIQMDLNLKRTAKFAADLTNHVGKAIDRLDLLGITLGNLSHEANQVNEISKDALSQVGKSSLEIKTSIQDIVKKTTEIGKVVSVIDDIAIQSNLLALNAAIEAARAGEAGRGFAVVAEEVQNLAENSVKATKDISEAILSVQDNVKYLSELSSKNLESIKVAVQKTSGLANNTSATTQKQAEESRALASSVGDMGKLSQDIAQATLENSSAVSEVSRSVDTVHMLMKKLVHGGEEQKIAVSQIVYAIENIASDATKNMDAVRSVLQEILQISQGSEIIEKSLGSFNT